MIRKTTLAVVAALVVGTASGAYASAMDNDANTGLWSYIYYGTLDDLAKQGLPISANAKAYVREHNSVRAAAPTRQNAKGRLYLYEDRSGTLRQPRAIEDNDDKQSGHLW